MSGEAFRGRDGQENGTGRGTRYGSEGSEDEERSIVCIELTLMTVGNSVLGAIASG